MPASSPSTSLYQLGRGVVSIGEWNGTTPPASYTDVGNSPRFEVEVTEETLDHYSSRSGTRLKDKTVIVETGYTLNFDLDEISIKNLQMFLKATLSGAKSHILLANTVLDKEYAVKFDSANPAGPDETWEFWRAKLSPGGPFSLIGDEWSLITFSAEGLADTANHATSPYFTVTFATTTTTTV
jgi:hypothetical protein